VGGKYYVFGFISSRTIWRNALTVLNVSSEAGEDPPPEVGRSSWKWIALIGVLALVVICLNTGLETNEHQSVDGTEGLFLGGGSSLNNYLLPLKSLPQSLPATETDRQPPRQ
jgi:hypothetical protein